MANLAASEVALWLTGAFEESLDPTEKQKRQLNG